MPVEVNIEAFEGPLDLLLHLIQEEELPITEVSLSRIADQYLEQLAHVEDRSPENLSQFLVVAAQLLLLKSRALLPQEEQEELEEDVTDLTERLRDLQSFREAAKELRDRYAGPTEAFEPRFYPPPQALFVPEGVTSSSLADALKELLIGLAKERQLLQEETLEATVTVDEKIDEIRSYIKKGVDVSFLKLVESATSKTELVVTFLSTLELMKQQEVEVRQADSFSDIIISSR